MSLVDGFFGGIQGPGGLQSPLRPTPPKLGTVRPIIVRPPPPGTTVDELARVVRKSLANPGPINDSTLVWFLADRYFDTKRASKKVGLFDV
jgi:hypothetical protein